MTFPTDFAAETALTEAHKSRTRRFWTPTEHRHDPVSPSQSASSGHPGDAAVQDAPPNVTPVRHARKPLRRLGVSVARPAAVATPVPPIPVVHPSFVSLAAERITEGPWGPVVWVVSNVVSGLEVARYPAAELDGPGAILRYLEEDRCRRERQRRTW